MGMKFHKFYVAVLNPLAIILVGIVTVLLLIVALNPADLTTEEMTISGIDLPYFRSLDADAILWALFGIVAAVFLFMLITEFLLVARRKSGIVLLSLSLILGIISNVVSFARYTDQTPWYTMVISVVISALVLAYYWRRFKEFS